MLYGCARDPGFHVVAWRCRDGRTVGWGGSSGIVDWDRGVGWWKNCRMQGRAGLDLFLGEGSGSGIVSVGRGSGLGWG